MIHVINMGIRYLNNVSGSENKVDNNYNEKRLLLHIKTEPETTMC